MLVMYSRKMKIKRVCVGLASQLIEAYEIKESRVSQKVQKTFASRPVSQNQG